MIRLIRRAGSRLALLGRRARVATGGTARPTCGVPVPERAARGEPEPDGI
jgi:hypothetical protein